MTCVLGIDPGPVPGFFLASWEPDPRRPVRAYAWQCNADGAPGLLVMILDWCRRSELDITCGQIEEFRTLAGPGSKGRYAAVTRGQVIALGALAAERGVKLAVRHSSQAFPWATDRRLRAAGLYEVTTALPHARAASRHALFTAVHDCGLPDPLSEQPRKW